MFTFYLIIISHICDKKSAKLVCQNFDLACHNYDFMCHNYDLSKHDQEIWIDTKPFVLMLKM